MVQPEEKLPIGTLGLSLEDIPVGETGEAYFPDLKIRARVYAVEYIRKNRDIIIVGANNAAKEHSPVEISYETATGVWQRVTETHPLPVSTGYRSVLYVSKVVTASGNTLLVSPSSGKKIRVYWYSISNRHSSMVDVGLRFGETGEIKHRYALAAEGGCVVANLVDAPWGDGEALYAYAGGNYTSGVYFNIAYSEV